MSPRRKLANVEASAVVLSVGVRVLAMDRTTGQTLVLGLDDAMSLRAQLIAAIHRAEEFQRELDAKERET